MDLVLLLLAIAVVGGAAAVALGTVRGGLEPPTSTLPDLDLPTGPLAPDDVERIRFSLGLRGYRMDQVDVVLDRLGRELGGRDDEIAALRALVEQAPVEQARVEEARVEEAPVERAPVEEARVEQAAVPADPVPAPVPDPDPDPDPVPVPTPFPAPCLRRPDL